MAFCKAIWNAVHPLYLQPTDRQGNLIPDVDADYHLFDRVVNVSTNNAVPFGLRGTVSGILGGEFPFLFFYCSYNVSRRQFESTFLWAVIWDLDFLISCIELSKLQVSSEILTQASWKTEEELSFSHGQFFSRTTTCVMV